MTPSPDDLRWVLDGPTRAILGSGERVAARESLPRDEGNHLVAARALRARWTSAPIVDGTPSLDPSGRWLGLLGSHEGAPMLSLFDGSRSFAPAFRFFPAFSPGLAIHPEGDLIAYRDGDNLCLDGPDGERFRTASFPISREWWADESFTFSLCGRYLWLATTRADGAGKLLLLDCPSLSVRDQHDPTHDPQYPYDVPGKWHELATAINPVTGHFAARRQIGGAFLTLHFYCVEDGKIVLEEPALLATQFLIPGETVDTPVFSSSGHAFVLRDSDNFLHVFTLPEAMHLAGPHLSNFRHNLDDFNEDWGDLGFVGGFVLAQVGKDLMVLRTVGLEFSPLVLPTRVATRVLPNGWLVSPSRQSTASPPSVQTVTPHGEEFPVVAVLNSATHRIIAVYEAIDNQWCDIHEDLFAVFPAVPLQMD